MTNPLKHVHELDGFSEAYEVVRTALVVLDGQTYRIEILKSQVPTSAAYTARCAVSRRVPAQVLVPPALPTGAPPDDTVTVWVEHPLSPPVVGDRAKQALADALGRLMARRLSEAASPPRPRRRVRVASSASGQ
jgi:hypothetical protein